MKNQSFSDLAQFVVALYEAEREQDPTKGKDNSFAPRVVFWIDRFGHRDITTITRADVEAGIDALVDKDRTKIHVTRVDGKRVVKHIPIPGQKISPASVNRYVASLGTVFKTLLKKRKLPFDFNSPMKGATRFEEGEGRTLSVTIKDVQRLVACARVSRNRKLAAMVAMACTTGWRKGTIQSVKWGDIDLREGIADTGRTKNGTPHRAVLLPMVLDELRRIKPEQAGPNDPVFGKTNVDKGWHNATKLAGLPAEWTFHHCRHIAASVLAQSGASTVQIMSCLNHKSPQMAMRYSHLNTDSLRESMSKAWGAAA
jgi:integrase